MKIKIFVLFVLFMYPLTVITQTNSEIANVYVKRAEDSFYNLEIDKSLEIFNKALKYMDSIPNSRVAKLGTLLHYEHKNYFEARSYARLYFQLETDKSTEEYGTMLETVVNIQDEIDEFIIEQKALKVKRLREERETRRLDSLNNLWTNLSRAYTIKMDSIYKFNQYNLAVFSKNGQLGIMDDVGTIVEKTNDYEYFISYDGYIMMLDKQKNPSKIYVYNCATKRGLLLPSVSAFNPNAVNYGRVMLPRANGLIITYPYKSEKAYVYNVKEKSFVVTEDLKNFLKTLKKNDIIEKYKDEQLRINKQWFTLGSHLGAGVYELYEADKRFGFINTSDGKVWDVNYCNYLGGYNNGIFELIEGEKRFWMTTEGIRREANKNENGSYSGNSRFVKSTDGSYIILQNREGRDYLILGENALLNQTHFVANATR